MYYFSRILISTSALIVAVSTASAGEQETVDFNYNKTAPIEQTYANFQATARKACKSELKGSVRYSKHQQKKYLADCQNYLVTKTIAATKNNELIVFHAKAIQMKDRIRLVESKN
jgi:hypothetical protein